MPASARVHADCFCKGGCQAPPRRVHATRCGTSHRNRASGQKHKLLPLRRGRCLRRSCRVGHWHRALCYAAGQPFRKVLRRLCSACSLTVGHVVGGTVSLTCAGAAGARRAAASAPHVGSWPDPGRSSTQVLLPTAADGHTRVAGMPLKWQGCHSSGILVVTRVDATGSIPALHCSIPSPSVSRGGCTRRWGEAPTEAAGARRAAPEGPWPLVQSVMAAALPDLPVGSCGCKQAPYPAGRSARSPASDLENRLWGDPNRLPPNLPLSESLAAQGAVTVLAWR